VKYLILAALLFASLAGAMEKPAPQANLRVFCDFKTWGSYYITSGRCFYGDVVTGENNGRLICSRADVSCRASLDYNDDLKTLLGKNPQSLPSYKHTEIR